MFNYGNTRENAIRASTENSKRFIKHFMNPWAIFENDPDSYREHGDCTLNLWIYFLKFFIRPIPLEAIRILEDEIEKLSQRHISCLARWDVNYDQAKIIVESRRRAFLNLFALELWGSKNPDSDCLNEHEVMRAHLYRSRDSHQSLMHEYETYCLKEAFKKNHKMVYKCINSILSAKKSTFSKLDSGANYDRTLIFNWTNGEISNDIPPLCMWSSQAIIKILKLEGHDLIKDEFDVIKNRLRKQINRLRLVRPPPPVPTFSVKYSDGKFSMYPTNRGGVNSGNQISGP